MKKTIALCAALVVGGAAFAQEESAYAVTVDFPYVSKYVFRGVQIARDSLQPSIEVSSGDFYAGVWSNVPLRNEHDGDASKEFDVYVGYTPKLTENLSADLGLTYYWYPWINLPSSDHSIEFAAGLNYTAGNLTPALYVYRDFHLNTTTVQTSVGYSLPLKDWGTSLDLSAAIGAVMPTFGEDYCYYSAGVNVPVKLSDAVKLNFGVTYTENDLDGAKDPGLWVTIGATARF